MSFVVRAPIAVAHRTAVVPRRTTDRPARAHTVATRKARKSTMARAEASASAGTGADVVFALDFDGVVCDSEPESSISGWKHGLDLWPEVFGPASAEQGRVLDGLKRVRPVVETGFENTLLARALLEKIHTADDIIADWGGLMPGLMERWNCDRGEMVAGYGKIRDDWMAADLNGWLAPNLVYPGVAEACIAAETSTHCDVFIVTTKQARFAQAIMEGKGDLSSPTSESSRRQSPVCPRRTSSRIFRRTPGTTPCVWCSWRISSAPWRRCARWAPGWSGGSCFSWTGDTTRRRSEPGPRRIRG